MFLKQLENERTNERMNEPTYVQKKKSAYYQTNCLFKSVLLLCDLAFVKFFIKTLTKTAINHEKDLFIECRVYPIKSYSYSLKKFCGIYYKYFL